jgi:antitoxin MazE
MRTTLRRIGNSKGVLIPAAFLASCRIEDQVDMQLRDGQIVITPLPRTVREGWFAPPASGADLAHEAAELQVWDAVTVTDDSEWVW